jgi:hypothetical protein
MTTTPKVPAKLFGDYLQSLDLTGEELDQIAIVTGWQQREPRKITPAALLSALCLESINGQTSFNDIGSRIVPAIGQTGPSRQAVGKRLNDSFREILEFLLALLVKAKVGANALAGDTGLFSRHKRILVQDSTVIQLPAWLFGRFSGVSNAHQTVCNARIQVVYDLKAMCFLSFEICPYTKNDIKAAPELELAEGDLVLRDRGYLSAGEIARHNQQGARCIYRHRTGTRYLDPETRKDLDLLAGLRKNGRIDRMVALNDREKTLLRLVAAPVGREVADMRRRKAKKETRGHKPSVEMLALMDWTIFLTNAPGQEAGFNDLLMAYGLRWRIEVIFKTWKSHLSFDSIHRVSETELKIILMVRLLLITEGTNVLYRLCHQEIRKRHERDLSLQKFIKRLSRDPGLFSLISEALDHPGDPETRVWDHLARYCCYDKRKRKNFFNQCREAR